MKGIDPMKKPRHIPAFPLVLFLIFSFISPVSAATVENYTGRAYRAFQIFEGYPSVSDWGGGIDSENLLVKLHKEGESYSECSTAADVAAVLSEFQDGSEEAEAFAGFCFVCLVEKAEGVALTADSGAELEPGYYLLLDEDTDALALLPVGSDDLEIGSKTDETTAVIKVQDVNDSTGAASDWQDSADYDVGDAVPFRLSATITESFSTYDPYYLAFHVTESEGLTFDPGSVSIFLDGEPCKEFFDILSDTDGTFSIACENLKKIPAVSGGSVVTVEYSSVLNANAACGSAGNPSKLILTYSADAGKSRATTPGDTVNVFTYQLTIRNLDGQGNQLAGADFALCKQLPSGEIELSAEMSKDGAAFTFSGLDDGQYILTQTAAPDGCTPMEPVAFEISAEHETMSDDPKLIRLSASGGGLTFTASAEQGFLSADVLNQQSVILPSTGGPGTTGFYFAGGLLAGGAALLLRRRARR